MFDESLPRQKPRPASRRHEVPTRILEEDVYPIGGFASISTRGSVESLLHSQLAFMENDRPDLFDIKFLRDELLYYSRDENSFLRRRRTFVFVLYPDLVHARFKDADLPFQRIVLLLALLHAALNRLIDWLSTDSLVFEIILIAPNDVGLAAEKELLDVLLAEPIANGTATIQMMPLAKLKPHCVERAAQPVPLLIGEHEGADARRRGGLDRAVGARSIDASARHRRRTAASCRRRLGLARLGRGPGTTLDELDMTMKALVSWSGGKDCMLALWHGRQSFDVAALLTTVTHEFDRISMHGVRVELLRRQADSLGLPLRTVEIPHPCSNAIYEQTMKDAWAEAQSQGIEAVICGDLFLEDVRRYREDRLFGAHACVFPLWRRPTSQVASEFIELGFRAVLCCVDTQALPGEFAGREFDDALLRELPAGVDPCGENGEFHTFVYAGPLFQTPIAFERGAVVLREGRFSYCDLVPAW